MSGNFGGSSSSKIVGTSDVNVAGNRLLVSDILNDRVLIFPLGPQNGGASVAPIVSNTNVTMTLSADDAKDVMVSENSDLSGASWQSFSASLPFTLSSGDGVKTVYVKYRDYVNYEGSVLSATTTLDTVAPTGTLAINAGSTLTKTKEVTLALASADSGQMKISNASDFDVASWETYAATKAHTLTTPDGLKTVYVKYKDAAGNESETYTATIALDTTKPVTKITDIGLITNVPDKTPLFYYFTSQTPRIKGTTEALSIVHFTYDGNDYTTTANGSGNYEIDIPELPRQYVELTYYAIDPAGNQGTNRLLKLMIGVENFPAELLPQDEETVTPTETPADGTPIPTPSETPTETIQVFGIQVTDQNGNPLAETAVYIDGQRYVTDKNGKIYIEKQPTEDMTLEVEINGQRIKGTVMGEKIVAEVPEETAKKLAGWYWLVLGVAFVGVSGYAYSLRKR